MLKNGIFKDIVLLDIKRTAFRPIQRSKNEFEISDFYSHLIRDIIINSSYNKTEIDHLVLGSIFNLKGYDSNDFLKKLEAIIECKEIFINSGKKTGLDTLLFALQTLKNSNKNMILCGGGECFNPLATMTNSDIKNLLIKITKAKTNLARLNILKYFSTRVWGKKHPSTLNKVEENNFQYNLKKHAYYQNITELKVSEYNKKNLEAIKKNYDSNCFEKYITKIWSLANISYYCQDLVVNEERNTQDISNNFEECEGACLSLFAKKEYALKNNIPYSLEIIDFVFCKQENKSVPFLALAQCINVILKNKQLKLSDIKSFEIIENHPLQILSLVESLDSDVFCRDYLKLDKKLGKINLCHINSFGGSFVFGASSASEIFRRMIHLNHSLQQKKNTYGLILVDIFNDGAGAILIKHNDKL